MKIKLFEWIERTFGKPKHGDLINFSEQITEKEKDGRNYLITEIRLTYQIKKYSKDEISSEYYSIWKKELDEITENSIRDFHCEDSDVFASNLKGEKSGKSFLMVLNIFHKQEI